MKTPRNAAAPPPLATDPGVPSGVHALFTITGALGASTCSLTQPDFAGALARHNVVFRIPTPVFNRLSEPDKQDLLNFLWSRNYCAGKSIRWMNATLPFSFFTTL